MPRSIQAARMAEIPADAQVTIKSRVVTVVGPKGTLVKDFRHQSLEITKVDGKIRVEKWYGSKKELACIRTCLSHIKNMMTGVTKGFRYTMRFVYAHFPINVAITDDVCEIRNFLGERRVRRVAMRGITTIVKAKAKDTLILEGIDINDVSQSAADIQQSTRVRNKDIRKFLDGIYVSEAGPIEEE